MWVSCAEQYFPHTPDEAMSGGLAKVCVQRKKCSVSEKIEFLIKYSNRMRSLHAFIKIILNPQVLITKSINTYYLKA